MNFRSELGVVVAKLGTTARSLIEQMYTTLLNPTQADAIGYTEEWIDTTLGAIRLSDTMYYFEVRLIVFLMLNRIFKQFFTTDKVALLDIIHQEIEHIATMLEMKNRKYGNSCLDPVRVFSKSTPLEQINVRMDDKLSRLRYQGNDEDEDVVTDLIGYLILKLIGRRHAFYKSETDQLVLDFGSQPMPYA